MKKIINTFRTLDIQSQVIVYLLLGAIVSTIIIDHASKPIEYIKVEKAEASSTPVLVEAEIDWTPKRIHTEVLETAEKYHVNARDMEDVINCESQGSTTVQSHVYRHGKRENSWGLAQIFLDAHKDITKEQAINPTFAIDFMAKEFAQHHQYLWSCWGILHK